MNNNKSNTRIVIFIVLGLVIGAILGETLGWLFGYIGELAGSGKDNPVNTFFVKDWPLALGYNNPEGISVDLGFFKFKFGFGFRFNLMSLIGLYMAFHIEKWSKAR